ncbi:M50 family metallopeptidase [Sporobolomyces koalae]|uniref:M50 family metallopeptidase n=1 Tax=Sporobolomyces koalae TaxID=500713 RepID=UPI00317EB70A
MLIPPQDLYPLMIESIATQLAKRNSTAGPSTISASDQLDHFELSHAQWIKVYYIEATVMVYLLGWNLWIARSLLFPLKLCAVAYHEMCHALVGTLTGGRVRSVILDPNQGGATTTEGGWPFLSLPAGYIGSTTIGAALIFASFDLKASKIAAIPAFLLLCLVSWWARKSRFTLININFMSGLLVIAFFVSHSAFLPFLLIQIGVMNVMYSVFDQIDDLVLHKINASDVCAFQEQYPWFPAQMWGAIWTAFSLTGLTLAIVGGIVFFKGNFTDQVEQSKSFLWV